ncbi:hypothetical protein EVAR_46409_1 [Eumeta japonica]|uniref:Uncharacterized protein n=1 Tax=Eumeta variegata TaxID=151549 RepID=A0A4C1WWU1_EUMVA|nr:hypothetical protein EVAR_46409_1 [Eumeta japonica]
MLDLLFCLRFGLDACAIPAGAGLKADHRGVPQMNYCDVAALRSIQFQHENGSAQLVRYRILTEYRREVVTSVVAFSECNNGRYGYPQMQYQIPSDAISDTLRSVLDLSIGRVGRGLGAADFRKLLF